jgi:hypothetical protein
MAEYWFTDSETLRQFGSILNAAGAFDDSEDFQSFLDEPFQYNDEYKVWLEQDSPSEGDENWEAFVDAITSDDDDESNET